MMFNVIASWFSITITFFALGLATLIFTGNKRRRLSKYVKIEGSMSPFTKKHYSIITWKFKGEEYYSAPLKAWSFRKNSVYLLIDPQYETDYIIDHWTTNYIWGYFLSGFFMLISLFIIIGLYIIH